MIISNSVLLLKSQISDEGEDKYEKTLVSQNFKVKQIKTLVFNYKNIEKLVDKIATSDKYSGLILSSPRCVHSVHLAFDHGSYFEKWKKKHNFVVGEQTYKEALEKLSLKCQGKEAGNAVNLSKYILEQKSLFTKPFLFPHGNLRTDTLMLELGKKGLEVEEIEVYDTLANPNIEADLAEATDQFQSISEYVVFFSPSGFSSCIEHIKKIPVDIKQIKFIAIGPVTETAILKSNLPVYKVAKRPNPDDLLNAVLGEQ